MFVNNEILILLAYILQLFDKATLIIIVLQINIHNKKTLRFIKFEITKKIIEKNKKMKF